MFGNRFESRIKKAGGSLANLLRQAHTALNDVSAVQSELAEEVAKLRELDVEANKIRNLALKLIALSEE